MDIFDEDPNGIYGLKNSKDQADILYWPIPWDVTTSYMAGTALGPRAILKASPQLDLFDRDFQKVKTSGFFMMESPAWIEESNQYLRSFAEEVMDTGNKNALKRVNEGSEKLNQFIYKEFSEALKQHKMPIVVGGDHSTPFGAIKAYSEYYSQMGILHIDAHSDTRLAYQGFEHSHASIMRNVATLPGVHSITQVGIRDFCQEEYEFTKSNSKFQVFFDQDLQRRKMQGTSFSILLEEILETLPKNVYLSLDIDGLDPRYCPNTGTPVPGGLDISELFYLITSLHRSGRNLVGFDLVEVGPEEWDGNVGMRVLYKLSLAALSSRS